MIRWSISAFVVGAALLVLAVSARAASQPWVSAPVREVEPLATELRASLAQVQRLLATGEFRAALDALGTATWNAANAHEHAQIDSMIAYAWFGLGDYGRAIESYQRVLAEPDRIPLRLEIATLYSLAELSLAAGEYRAALDYAQRWRAFGQTPDATALAMIAKIHYALADYRSAIVDLETAITRLDDPRTAPEDWWTLLAYLYQTTGDWPQLVNLLEALAESWPDPQWDLRLADARARMEPVDPGSQRAATAPARGAG